nr:MAG TPA: hypothetical protein [Bacteriophage sp.]
MLFQRLVRASRIWSLRLLETLLFFLRIRREQCLE